MGIWPLQPTPDELVSLPQPHLHIQSRAGQQSGEAAVPGGVVVKGAHPR